MNDDRFGLAAALREAQAQTAAGQIAEAEANFAQIAGAAPTVALALRELAVAALRRDDCERSVELFQRSIAIEPNDWLAHGNLGVALRGLKRYAEAVTAYDAALALRPGAPLVWGNRGNALIELDRFDDALESFDRMVAMAPDRLQGHLGRTRALLNLSRLDEALDSAARALKVRPGDHEALFLRANGLLALRRPQEALQAYDAAISASPDHALSHGGRARTLVELFYAAANPPSVEEIDASFARARALDPDSAELAYAQSLFLMRQRRFAEGWPAYERRWEVPHFRNASHGQVKPDIQRRLARNLVPEALDGRNVLLVSEQGVGDDIMFASIIPDVLARAASAALVCDVRLHRLFRAAFPALRLVAPLADGGVAPECDLIVATGSLGRIFRNRLEDFPGTPYLRPTDGARAAWATWLGPRQGLRVGVSWRGGIQSTEGDRRSMPLATLRPLLTLDGCEFVNLQYGDVAAELAEENANLPRPIRSPGPGDMSDFDDLAGLVANMDLVVSVQTTLVHLSGAIGAPCLAMIPRKPEWRYGADGESMPWYSSVRLLRQGADGEWASVIARVTDEVARRVKG